MLQRWGSLVVIILVHLGVLTWLMYAVARLRSVFVVGLAAVAYALAPLIRDSGREWRQAELLGGADPDGLLITLIDVMAAGTSYRVTTLLVWACLGALAVRWWCRPGGAAVGQLAAVAALSAVVGGLTLITLRERVQPYSGTYVEIALNAVLSLGVVAAGLWWGKRPWGTAQQVGQMTLTLYVLHVAVLARVARAQPTGDDSWLLLLVLILGSWLLAAIWRRAVPSGPFQRGPLEGLITLAITAMRPGPSPVPPANARS